MLSTNRNRGFTIAELMIVMVILGIFLAIATPSFRQLIINYQIRALAESILNGLQLARATAVQQNEPVMFVLQTSGGNFDLGWRVVTEAGVTVQLRSPGESSSSLTLTASPANATTVTFNGTGRTKANVSGSPILDTVNIDVPTTVMPAADSNDLRVRILSGGMIKLCNPNTTVTTDVTYCP